MPPGNLRLALTASASSQPQEQRCRCGACRCRCRCSRSQPSRCAGAALPCPLTAAVQAMTPRLSPAASRLSPLASAGTLLWPSRPRRHLYFAVPQHMPHSAPWSHPQLELEGICLIIKVSVPCQACPSLNTAPRLRLWLYGTPLAHSVINKSQHLLADRRTNWAFRGVNTLILPSNQSIPGLSTRSPGLTPPILLFASLF